MAALSVLVAHALDVSFNFGGQLWAYHSLASRLAYFGMSLFFVLSGFVIELNYGERFRKLPLKEAVYDFAVARFSRLYPLYLVAVILTLTYLPSPQVPGPLPVIAYATLTQTWFNMQNMVFTPGWSISAEWFFYVAFIPLTFVVAKIKRLGVVLAAYVVCTTIGLMWAFKYSNEMVAALTPWMWHNQQVSAGVFGWMIYFSPALRLLEFITGVIAARIYQSRPAGLQQSKSAEQIAWACFLWCLIVIVPANLTKGELSTITPNFIYAPAIATFLAVASSNVTTLGRLLVGKAILFLGEISYSIYIWSWFAMDIMGGKYVSQSASALAYFNSTFKLALIVGMTIIFAAGSYQLIEVPAQRWLRAKLRRA